MQTLGLVFLVAAKTDGSVVARNIDLGKTKSLRVSKQTSISLYLDFFTREKGAGIPKH